MADSTSEDFRTISAAAQASAAAQERARAQLASTGEALRNSASDALGQARSMVRDAAEQQKHRAAEGIQEFARSLHDMAGSLDQQHRDLSARYTHAAAEQLERAARGLEQRSMGDMLGEVEHLARRQPALFIGGAFAAGFLLARFVKSSAEAEPGTGDIGYGADTGYSAYPPATEGFAAAPPAAGPGSAFAASPAEVPGVRQSREP